MTFSIWNNIRMLFTNNNHSPLNKITSRERFNKDDYSENTVETIPHCITPSLKRLLDAARQCKLQIPNPKSQATKGIILSISSFLPPKMWRKNWRINDYTITRKLYTGYASIVYKATCNKSGQVVVIKIYTISSLPDLYKYQIYREISAHSRIKHKNVVCLYAAFQECDKVVMVQEYVDGDDLFSMLHKYGGNMNERMVVQMVLIPILNVLCYMHSNGIIHRDIKPDNIIINQNMEPMLCDFGLAIDVRSERAVTRVGTLDYMAPEVLRCPFKSRPDENKEKIDLYYGTSVDSWTVGVMTYELLIGIPPFYDQAHDKKNTEDMIYNKSPIIPNSVSKEACDFLEMSLCKNPDERIRICDMIHHEFITKYKNTINR